MRPRLTNVEPVKDAGIKRILDGPEAGEERGKERYLCKYNSLGIIFYIQ